MLVEVGVRTRSDKLTELFSQLLEPAAAGQWRPVEIDLPDSVRAGSTLEIAARAPSSCSVTPTVLAVSRPRILAAGRDARPSVVLLSIDTLRPDHLGLYGYSRDTSPELDAWARDHAVTFDDAWANAAWTLPSHASMLTGLTALQHGVNSHYPAPAAIVTLAERLRSAGYYTAAWTGGSWLSPKFGLFQGFDEFRWWTELDGGESELATHVDEIGSWLEAHQTTPLFLFVHTYEVHSPYRPRQPYFDSFTDARLPAPVTDRLLDPFREDGYLIRKQLEFAGGAPVPESDLPAVIAAYDSGIAHADALLGRLLAAIEQQLGDNVVILLTSDHGEALGEEGRVSHGRLEEEDLRIPWILRLPGDRGAGTRVASRVSSIDILPTVLEFAGLPPGQSLTGSSVVASIDRSDHGPASAPAVEAYAASSNLGLSLRLRDGGSFLFNDTPWIAADTRERWSTLRSEDSRLLDQLRAQVKERLTAATGLHLRIVNRELEPLAVNLRGPCVHPLTVKLTDPADPSLTWVRPQHARWTIDSGADLHIRFDTPVTPCLTVEIPDAGGSSFRLELHPRPGHSTWLASRVEGGWQVVETNTMPDGDSANSFIAGWLQGPLGSDLADPTADDDGLLEQLKTLGYLQ